jgi:hypothetical protein
MRGWLALCALLLALCVAGCGEKPCSREGAVKAEDGVLYHCADRRTGNGLRWYRS